VFAWAWLAITAPFAGAVGGLGVLFLVFGIEAGAWLFLAGFGVGGFALWALSSAVDRDPALQDDSAEIRAMLRRWNFVGALQLLVALHGSARSHG
jgi:hypothetical protein